MDTLLTTPPSPADRPGLVYAFVKETNDGILWLKFGRTRNIPRRRNEWKRQCPSAHQEWHFWVPTRYADRLGRLFFFFYSFLDASLEKIVHFKLEEICDERPNGVCPDCKFFLFLLLCLGLSLQVVFATANFSCFTGRGTGSQS